MSRSAQKGEATAIRRRTGKPGAEQRGWRRRGANRERRTGGYKADESPATSTSGVRGGVGVGQKGENRYEEDLGGRGTGKGRS